MSELGERQEVENAAELPQSAEETGNGQVEQTPQPEQTPVLDLIDNMPAAPEPEATAPAADEPQESPEDVSAATESSETAETVSAAEDVQDSHEDAPAAGETHELVEDEPAADEPEAAASSQPAEPGHWLDEKAIPAGPRRGDVIEGVITKTSPTSVLVDIGAKSEGIIPGRELERMSRQMIEALKEGEKIMVYVVNPDHPQGNILLSVNRAMEEMDWREAETYRQSQEVYEGQVAGYNKGGLIVRFGRLRGFVPQSQISDDRRRVMVGETPEERYGGMINEPISVKVMEVDRGRNRLILSERVAFRQVREKRKESLVNDLNVGEIRMGRIVSLEDFGVFVDIGGAEGLVHLTELSWKHVNHPRDILKVGQEVKVEVISLDKERKRIGLSIKRQESDPWDEVAINYNVGQLVQATVTKLTKFGAFARLVDAPDIEGLIHISELSDQRVQHPKEVVKEDDKLTLRVVKIDVKNRRLGLSLKRVNSAEYLDMDWAIPSDSDD
jgi:small subunit ribosomal protein S1